MEKTTAFLNEEKPRPPRRRGRLPRLVVWLALLAALVVAALGASLTLEASGAGSLPAAVRLSSDG
jgi:hypothetical protein